MHQLLPLMKEQFKRVKHLQRKLIYEYEYYMEQLFDYQHLINEIYLFPIHFEELYMNQIQFEHFFLLIKNQYIHIFNIIDDLTL